MSFTSPEFLIFLAGAAILFRFLPVSWRPVYILIISLLFYVTVNAFAAITLGVVTAVAYFAGLGRAHRGAGSGGKSIIAFSVTALVCYLIFWKTIPLLQKGTASSWMIPLGVSYYTFKLISYLLEVHWEKMPAERRFVSFAAYISFFPQIVAGPIERPTNFLSQISDAGRIRRAVPRIAWGLAKKLIIADHLAPAVNFVFAHVTTLHGAWWIGFYLWPLQLYADFSGLTDMAIGMGRLFGIEGPENFNRPFSATTISDYWRRWHMSLTTWLGDYVFTPLRIATRAAGKVGLVVSITVNMIAIALWHGFTWGYLAFGVLHSLFLSVDALSARWRKAWFKKHPAWNRTGEWVGWLLTFHLMALALVFFRANSLPDAMYLVRHIWSGVVLFPNELMISNAMFVGLAGYLVLELAERFRPDKWAAYEIRTGPRYLRWSLYTSCLLLLGIGFAVLLANSQGPKNPFVYAIF